MYSSNLIIFNKQNCFQVNSAVGVDRNLSQWIDLDIHTEACMTQPDTCDKAGGAVSFWIKVVNCPSRSCGIITTLQGGRFHGFLIRIFEGTIR